VKVTGSNFEPDGRKELSVSGEVVWVVYWGEVIESIRLGVVPPGWLTDGIVHTEAGSFPPSMVFDHEPVQVVERDEMGEYTVWK